MGPSSYADAQSNLTTSINAPTKLASDVNSLAPLATVMHGPTPAAPLPNYVAPSNTSGGLAKFGSFLSTMVGEVGHVAASAASWLKTNAVNLAEAPLKLGTDIGHGLVDRFEIDSINTQNDQFSGRLATLTNLYKSGGITSKEYSEQLKELNQSQNQLVQESNNLSTRVKGDQQATTKAAWDTAATLVTVLTAGVGAGGDPAYTAAAKFVASDAADSPLIAGAAKLNEIAMNPELQKSVYLSAANKAAIQRSIAEVVVQNTGHMTAEQISRASVMNMALKYPIYYNMLSSTGDQVYKELDNKQYGSALRTVAFNALLLLSGGPIGHALKYGGGAVKEIAARTFTTTPFLDELSRGIGNGDASGLYKAITNIKDPSAFKFFDANGNFQQVAEKDLQARIIKNMSAVEATNLAATGKTEPVAAAWRVINGMAANEGASMSTFTHDEALVNMHNDFEVHRALNAASEKAGLGPVVTGRLDLRQARSNAAALREGTDEESSMKIWTDLKRNNPSFAWANSTTYDKQITAAIKKFGGGEPLAKAVNDIKAGVQIKGLPENLVRNASKMGYVAVQPANIEAPFIEGAGKLTSKFAENSDLWTKAVAPLPVMSHVGDMLTGLGLSPNASVQRAYQLYNANLAENLNRLNIAGLADELTAKGATVVKEDTSAVEALKKQGYDDATIAKLKTENPEDFQSTKVTEKPEEAQTQSDFINKVLADYRNNPTRGRLARAMPITDYRQMTDGDIQTAFKNKKIDISGADAHRIGRAIDQSWLQMPLAIRGLGDKAVDLNFRFNPLAGRYSRLQGSLRFAWNPFYQNLRAIPKTEILASAKGGGYVNAVFSGEFKQIGPVRELLRDKGIFDEKGGLGTAMAGAEAVEASGDTGRNLGRRLLPQQERSIAGLVVSKANKADLSVATYVEQFPNEVRDMVQAIAEYDRKANFLNSPMVRTLNLAIFPFRFELKVGTAMAKALANTSAVTQMAFIKGAMNAHIWLNSAEGQAWYSHNSEAIGLFEYMTPLATISEVGDALGLQHNAIGEYGELGGLPFGFIPQILDAEGLTHFNQPGVDAKTGAVIPSYIPQTARGQAETAIQDFLGSLFTYPGATIGAPSKASITRTAAMGITGANKKKDLKLVTPTNLSDQQRSYSDAIQQMNGTTPQVPTPPPARSQVVPTLPTPATTPKAPKNSPTSAKKKTKAQFTPQLIPGQSALGQL